jgi:diguanylate cyclase (GGDEF)-like protein
MSFGNLERRSDVLRRRAETRARRDGLTGAMNRASFANHARREIGQHRRIKSNMSLLFIDVDHFKRINDTYGHETGDQVLKRIIRLTRGCLRSGDTVARWGGEEFVVLLPATDLNGALLIAEKIRHRIGVEHFDELATGLQVTVSIGCAEMSSSEGLNELVARADRALYEAKHRGRNQTVAA